MIVSNLNIGITLKAREELLKTKSCIDNKENTRLGANRLGTISQNGSKGKTPIFENDYFNGSSGRNRGAAQKTATSSPLLKHSGVYSDEGCQQVLLRRYSEIWDSIPSSIAKPVISPAFSYQSAPFCKESATYII